MLKVRVTAIFLFAAASGCLDSGPRTHGSPPTMTAGEAVSPSEGHPEPTAVVSSGNANSGNDIVSQPTACARTPAEPGIVTSAPDVGTLTDLFVNATGAYFTEGSLVPSSNADPLLIVSLGSVRSAPLAGGESTIHWSGPEYAQSVVATATTLYFMTATRGTIGRDAHLFGFDFTDKDPQIVASWASDGTATALALALPDTVCWSYTTGTGGQVQCKGMTASVAAFPSEGLLAANGTSVFWVSLDSLMYMSITDHRPLLLAQSGGIRMSGLAASPSSDDIFISAGNVVQRITSGSATDVQVTPQPTTIQRIATDGRFLYWTDSAAGSVNAVPVSGGQAVQLATGQRYPTKIVVFGGSVYWLDIVSKQVLKTDVCP